MATKKQSEISKSTPRKEAENDNYFKALGRLLSGPEKDQYKKGMEVDAEKAQACADSFQYLMKYITDKELFYFRFKYAETIGVAFTGDDLSNYIKVLLELGETIVNNIKIVFGIYTQDFVKKYPEGETDKLTVFLWPYLDKNPSKNPNGTLLNPYNLGGLDP